MSVCGFMHVYADVQRRPDKATGSPGRGDTGCCELPAECWELNSDPLQEQQVLTAQALLPAPVIFHFNSK